MTSVIVRVKSVELDVDAVGYALSTMPHKENRNEVGSWLWGRQIPDATAVRLAPVEMEKRLSK